MDIAYYRKKAIQPMYPWTPESGMADVSIAQEDANNGSPQDGDMIAVNPINSADKWLVAGKFFKDNYELIDD